MEKFDSNGLNGKNACDLCFLLPVSTGLPVMVWIFGGGFLKGASHGANFLDNYLYDGQEIADRGNVIVVTLSYRLGTLGFLSSGDSELPGNYPKAIPKITDHRIK